MGSVNCDDKLCIWSYQVMESCVIYKATNNSNCQIPCKLEGCDFDITNGDDCQLWKCTFYPTTTAAPADLTLPQIAPKKKVLLNIVLIIFSLIALSIVMCVFVKKLRISVRAFLHTFVEDITLRVTSRFSRRARGFQVFHNQEQEQDQETPEGSAAGSSSPSITTESVQNPTAKPENDVVLSSTANISFESESDITVLVETPTQQTNPSEHISKRSRLSISKKFKKRAKAIFKKKKPSSFTCEMKPMTQTKTA